MSTEEPTAPRIKVDLEKAQDFFNKEIDRLGKDFRAFWSTCPPRMPIASVVAHWWMLNYRRSMKPNIHALEFSGYVSPEAGVWPNGPRGEDHK